MRGRIVVLEPVAKEIRDLRRRSFAMAVEARQEDQVQAMVERAVNEFGRRDRAGVSLAARRPR